MDIRPLRPMREFFATMPTDCPYLEGRLEQKLVVELKGPELSRFYGDLSRAGFRRSHDLAYRPACHGCQACVPVRIDVTRFAETRSLARIRRRTADLTREIHPPLATERHFRLFTAYLASRHASSDMAAMSPRDYRSMVEATPLATDLVELQDASGAPRVVTLVDAVPDALSAVYSFFDPDQPEQSLGTRAILELVDIAAERGLDHVYLGYWIAESRTMAYKRRFPALQGLIDGAWVDLPRLMT